MVDSNLNVVLANAIKQLMLSKAILKPSTDYFCFKFSIMGVKSSAVKSLAANSSALHTGQD